MKILAAISELQSVSGPVTLAIGVFDGLHLGHQAVLNAALDQAHQSGGTALPLTFDPHPACILRPESAPRLLTATRHKVQLFERLGFSHALILPFTPELAATPAEAFVRSIHEAVHPAASNHPGNPSSPAVPLTAICVGEDWSFGKGRSGNLQLLSSLGSSLGFKTIGIPPVLSDGAPISSTRVRGSIAAGDFVSAQAMLGRPFTVLGSVTQGNQLGRTIGFPTANLSLFNEQLPPNGVYAVRVDWKGKTLSGVANLGTRPTLNASQDQPNLEVHLLDFSGDLYGELLEVAFVSHIREETRFPSIESLTARIALDAKQARQLLSLN